MNKGSNLPLRKCPECGGSYFRQVKLHREPGTEMVDMPMWVLMCLCGAVQRPNVGGVRGGRTPNRLINDFVDALDASRRCREVQADHSPVRAAAAETLVDRGRLKKLQASIHRLERQISRRKARKSGDGKIAGGVWRQSKRTPASHGRDALVVELQKRGFTFDQARAGVRATFEVMTKALGQGESIEVPPLGTFRVQQGPPSRLRISLGKLQRVNRKPKRVVYEPHPGLVAAGSSESNQGRQGKDA